MQRNWRDKFQSRKFWVALVGGTVGMLSAWGLDADPEVIAAVGPGLWGLWMVMEGIIDAIKK